MIIVMAFVVNEIRNLIIIPSISIILIYSLTIFHIKSKLEIVFDEITKDFTEPEKLSVIQKKWLENPNICPACGTDLIIYDSFCPECGLNLSKHRKFEQEPCSRTGFYNSRITYKYKKNTQKM
ncbi:MAG TPA: hypothetical protein ENN45_04205 [Bacteroidetes bacterium]|nr:hypothetical protein [Bacteroidota bacterium]